MRLAGHEPTREFLADADFERQCARCLADPSAVLSELLTVFPALTATPGDNAMVNAQRLADRTFHLFEPPARKRQGTADRQRLMALACWLTAGARDRGEAWAALPVEPVAVWLGRDRKSVGRMLKELSTGPAAVILFDANFLREPGDPKERRNWSYVERQARRMRYVGPPPRSEAAAA